MDMQLTAKLKIALKEALGIRPYASNSQDQYALLRIYFKKHLEELLQGGWAIGLDDVQVINGEIERFLQFGNLSILEIGSGASTVGIIIKALDCRLNAVIHSIEENSGWIEKLQETISFAPTPLGQAGIEFGLFKSEYKIESGVDLESLRANLLKQYDIILIDSPPDNIVDDGRLKTAEQCLSLLKERGCMLIHDTNRIMELYAMKRLSDRFYDANLLNTCKGIGILRFPKT